MVNTILNTKLTAKDIAVFQLANLKDDYTAKLKKYYDEHDAVKRRRDRYSRYWGLRAFKRVTSYSFLMAIWRERIMDQKRFKGYWKKELEYIFKARCVKKNRRVLLLTYKHFKDNTIGIIRSRFLRQGQDNLALFNCSNEVNVEVGSLHVRANLKKPIMDGERKLTRVIRTQQSTEKKIIKEELEKVTAEKLRVKAIRKRKTLPDLSIGDTSLPVLVHYSTGITPQGSQGANGSSICEKGLRDGR
ncbi:hypothetical protein AAG570_012978 [Ranatra chinensis]|uniref:Uncharacterized protein n=1 Tax=Ranatra chinensis TaxID=642074 RepID=A0ABD0YFE8_9HEMI